MQKKWVFLNIIVLIIVILMLGWIIWTFSFSEIVIPSEECVDVNSVASFVYDSCYDAYSKNIFLEVKRGIDTYKINALEISFFDFSDQSYTLTDVPNIKGVKAYKIPSDRNPQNLYVVLDIVKDFSAPICDDPRNLFVRYCPVTSHEEDVGVFINPLNQTEVGDFIEIKRSSRQDSDVLGLSLVDKERIWKSECESRWECGEWEACDGDVQKRECKDKAECFIPTEAPETVKRCDGVCVENWECEWSNCKGGFTVPECEDLSNCGTSYDIPQKLKCGEEDKDCVPDVQCSEWSSCEVDYNFMDLVGGGINELTGSKSRLCVDKNNCAEPDEEARSCSIGIDIYTKRFSKCGEDFIGVYNRLDNDLIARISEGDGPNSYLNINLDDEKDGGYCDYCFDGRLSGDEEGIDCGGSCEKCSDKYQHINFEKKTEWTKFCSWVKRMFI